MTENAKLVAGFIKQLEQTAKANASPPPDDPILTEAGRVFGELLKLHETKEPNSPNKTHYMVQISPDFLLNASSKDTERLFAAIPIKGLSFSALKGEKGLFAFTHKDAALKRQRKTQKPSVLGDLTSKAQEVKARPAPDTDKPRKKNPDIS